MIQEKQKEAKKLSQEDKQYNYYVSVSEIEGIRIGRIEKTKSYMGNAEGSLGDMISSGLEAIKTIPEVWKTTNEFSKNPNSKTDSASKEAWKTLGKHTGDSLYASEDVGGLALGKTASQQIKIRAGEVLYGATSSIESRYAKVQEEARNIVNTASLGIYAAYQSKPGQAVKTKVLDTILPKSSLAKRQLEELGIQVVEKSIGLKVDGTTRTGLLIDEALNNNLGRTFPVFDHFENGVATSVKSIDLNAKAYQNGSGLYSKLHKDLRAIRDFKYKNLNGIELDGSDIKERVLNIVINDQLLKNEQIKNITRVMSKAEEYGIIVKITTLK